MILKGMVRGYSKPKGYVECDGKQYLFNHEQVKGSIANRMEVSCKVENDEIVEVYGNGYQIEEPEPKKEDKPQLEAIDYILKPEEKAELESNFDSDIDDENGTAEPESESESETETKEVATHHKKNKRRN